MNDSRLADTKQYPNFIDSLSTGNQHRDHGAHYELGQPSPAGIVERCRDPTIEHPRIESPRAFTLSATAWILRRRCGWRTVCNRMQELHAVTSVERDYPKEFQEYARLRTGYFLPWLLLIPARKCLTCGLPIRELRGRSA
jgi:hypothetical protein